MCKINEIIPNIRNKTPIFIENNLLSLQKITKPGNTLPKHMDAQQHLEFEEKIVEMLKTVFDPEIPVDIYSLGLVYRIDLSDTGDLTIDMTMTAPSCPMADFIVEDARLKLESIEGIKSVTINVVFEPEWTKEMMSEEAKLELGFL